MASVLAGKWGARGYNCDPPQITFESTLEQVKSHQPDLVFWTGDSTPHDEPFLTTEEVTNTLESIVKVVQKHFPDSADNFAFSLGNHDNYPPNQ